MSEETRVSTYYAVFFLSIGAIMPFIALWLEALGISTTMSGVILAAPPMAIVIFNVVIGNWADRLSDWRTAIIACNVFVLLLSSGLLLWQSQWGILLLWTLSGLFVMASVPITDAAALDMTARRGTDYAKVRAFGSAGFIVGILLAGKLFDSLGMHWFVGVLLVCGATRVAAALALPKFRDPSLSNRHTPKRGLLTGMTLFRQPGIFSVILGAALIGASHSFYNIYSVFHWTKNDIPTFTASSLWAIGVFAEVILMWWFTRFSKRISARHCLLVACGTCTFRWFITGTNPDVGVLIFLQLLHAITFGLTFLASVNFIAKRVDAQHAAQAQSVLATLTTTLMAMGTWFSGHFYSQLGGQSYWAMAVMAFIGGVLILNSYRSQLEDKAMPEAVN